MTASSEGTASPPAEGFHPEQTGDRYQVLTFVADETLAAIGHAAFRGYMTFEIKQRVRGLGYTPVGQVGVSWWQLTASDVALINAGGVEPVFSLDSGHATLEAGDWCARAWVRVAEQVPLDVKLGGPL